MEQYQKPSPSSIEEVLNHEIKELMLSLPTEEKLGAISFQRHFKARDQDIIVATQPKSGTTWLKALVFAIINRDLYELSENPLLSNNPHSLVQYLDMLLYSRNEIPNLNEIPDPRLFGTHMPYTSLPESIKKSKCRLVYICRNPLDTIVSLWQFVKQIKAEQDQRLSIDECAESFAKGQSPYGPFWEHVLDYWKVSLENPDKVLFLKYEDLMENTGHYVKKLAEFMGRPFSPKEETSGVIEQIIQLCSLNTMKNLEVNQKGRSADSFDYKLLFRNGVVGDWVNHLSSSTAEGIKSLNQEKLNGSGLDFNI